jgi:hypothetical protein
VQLSLGTEPSPVGTDIGTRYGNRVEVEDTQLVSTAAELVVICLWVEHIYLVSKIC